MANTEPIQHPIELGMHIDKSIARWIKGSWTLRTYCKTSGRR